MVNQGISRREFMALLLALSAATVALCGFTDGARSLQTRALTFFDAGDVEDPCDARAAALSGWLDGNAEPVGAAVSALEGEIRGLSEVEQIASLVQWREGFFAQIREKRTEQLITCPGETEGVSLVMDRYDDLVVQPLIDAVAEAQATHEEPELPGQPANLVLAGAAVELLDYYVRAYLKLSQALEGDCDALALALDRWFDGHMTIIDQPGRDLARELRRMTPEELEAFSPRLGALANAHAGVAPISACVELLDTKAQAVAAARDAAADDGREALQSEHEQLIGVRDRLSRVQHRMEDWILSPVLTARSGH